MEPVKESLVKGEDGIYRPSLEALEAAPNVNKEPEKEEVINQEENTTEAAVGNVAEEEQQKDDTEEKEEEIKEAPSENSEEPKEDASENKEEEKEEDVEVKTKEIEPVKSLSEKDVLNFLSEKLGKDLNSLDDLTAGDKTEEKPVTDLDRALQDLKEWSLKSGLPFEDYFKHQKDYESMSSLKIVEEEIRYKNPDFTEDEIKLEMEQYIPDEDVDDDRDTALKNLKLKKDSKVARATLNDLKADLTEYTHDVSLSEEQKADIELAKNVKQYQKEQQESKDQYDKSIKNEASILKSIPIKLDDDLTIDYNFSDTDRNEVSDFAIKMDHWYNKDGSMKYDVVVKEAAILKNLPKIFKIIYQQGLSGGEERLMNKSNNSTLGNAQQKTFDNQTGSIENKPKYLNVSKEMAPYII